jgi:hypothetical protein
MQPKLVDLCGGQSSTNPTGERKVWDLVWKANFPPKLRIFAWRVASDSLGTRRNLNRRIATVNTTCSICGCVVEDSHHALISCTVARALREELRMQWVLPDELAFRESQKKWIFALLGNAPKDQRIRGQILSSYFGVLGIIGTTLFMVMGMPPSPPLSHT